VSSAPSRPARVDHLVTSGTFSLDGQTHDLDNNVWLLGDDEEVLVIDAPHDVDAIVSAVGGRRVVAIACTHAHDDHVRIAPDLRAATGAPILLHPSDMALWVLTHPTLAPDGELADGQTIDVAGTTVHVLHTPGHAPGAVCFYVPSIARLFSGDTLFKGGPGATGRTYSDFPTIVQSISERLLSLPPDTVVHPGHGDDTSVGAEAPHVQEWLDRGH
jgi:glyoxylase-like metal-dependent hydrolase (beta-lactamase superfamily II)